jgi:ABC-type glycerol-3-phosphate transport system substrate-binding protein
MRKILLAMVLLLSAAACGSSPTASADAGKAQLTEDDGRPPVLCTRYALAGGNRTCES